MIINHLCDQKLVQIPAKRILFHMTNHILKYIYCFVRQRWVIVNEHGV